jgi:outer membrane protein assembly factor BamB
MIWFIHKGHAYGYEGMKLVCVDLKDGSRKWKEGRYGGQMLLLADQDLLIILTERGDIALVNADPENYTELNRIQAIEGKTWNHPVIANDILLVRNTKEMLALKLTNKSEI